MKKLIIVIENTFSYIFKDFEKNRDKIMQKHGISYSNNYVLFDEEKIEEGKLSDLFNV